MSEAPTRFQKINENNPKYAPLIERLQEANKPSQSIFGTASVYMFERAKQFPDIPGIKTTAKQVLKNDKQIMAERSRDPYYVPYINGMLQGAYQDRTFKDIVLLEATFGSKWAVSMRQGRTNWKQIPDDVFVMFLKIYGERIKGKLAGLEESAHGSKPQIDQKIVQFLSPFGLDPTVTSARLQKLGVTFKDPLWESDTQRISGYKEGSRDVVISASSGDWEADYIHEALHYLSGKTILLENGQSVDYQRMGLAINSRQQGDDRFVWLNEAVTEPLSKSILQRESKDGTSYTKEQGLLDLLLIKGSSLIDRNMVIQAYFENYDADKPYGERIPQWKAFNSAVNSAYSPGFLTRLDKYVQEFGVDKATKQLQTNWKVIDDQYPRRIPPKV